MNETLPTPQSPAGSEAAPATPVDTVQKFPVGLILIIILTGFAMIGSLTTLVNPRLFMGTRLVTGFPAFIYAAIHMAVMVALFVWLIQRRERGRILAIVVSAFNMIYLALQFLAVVFWPREFAEAMDDFMPAYSETVPAGFMAFVLGFMALLSWLVGGAVILYMVFKRRLFRK